MPSPIMHTAAGYVIFRLSRNRLPNKKLGRVKKIPGLLLITVIFSMLPDIDSLAGWLTGDFSRYHNNATHSFIVGLVVALIGSALISRVSMFNFGEIFLVIFTSYSSHILLDFFTIGRGVMALWPISQGRFTSPLSLFYGLHWSDGIFSIHHVWTIITESITALLITGPVYYLTSKDRNLNLTLRALIRKHSEENR
jgi:membrane-bound metal-dependent hydrolase YbcI (DUF457 family)